MPLPCLQKTSNSSLYFSVSGIIFTALLNAHEINTSHNVVESVVLHKGSSTVSQIAIKFLMLSVFIYISSSRTEFNLLGRISASQKFQKKFIKPKGESLNHIRGRGDTMNGPSQFPSLLPLNEQTPEGVRALVEAKIFQNEKTLDKITLSLGPFLPSQQDKGPTDPN